MRRTCAVLQARLYAQRRLVFFACAAAFAAGLARPEGLLAPLGLCTLLGIAMALFQSPGRHPHLDSSEENAPLFGRELARAKALVPCVAAALATAAYAIALFVRGAHDAALTFPIVLAAVIAATLTALSATIRRGAPRALYVALAALAAGAAYAIALHGVLAEVTFCALAGFLALRQYGEALARYDPI
jgi:uncharacterized membrane protein YhaH (DUF805 family)